jgi:hypothetical protein
MDTFRAWLANPLTLAIVGFQLWMLVDAIRNREWMWTFFILVFPGIGAFWYFFTTYRSSGSITQGFELPGAHDRKRIKELEAQIHHLDKPHHYLQLGDIYFQQGKLEKAEHYYKGAMERDGQDIDLRAHYGQCLLRMGKIQEAHTLLQGVIAEDPKHDYSHTLMALAETQTALREIDAAIATWRRVTEHHSYARARVQLAQLLIQHGDANAARAELTEVLTDDLHNPGFQRRRDRLWVKQAKKLIGRI